MGVRFPRLLAGLFFDLFIYLFMKIESLRKHQANFSKKIEMLFLSTTGVIQTTKTSNKHDTTTTTNYRRISI